jgi:peptidyl-dipeptidase A
MWRSGYDMRPGRVRTAETDRLWDQVKPLYEQLHCYAKSASWTEQYGKDKGEINGMIPAHLTGNLWAAAVGQHLGHGRSRIRASAAWT